MYALRRYRRSQPRGQQHFDIPEVTAGENLQQEQPKLSDIYVKPGLQIYEAGFKHFLPLAVRTASKRHVPLVIDALSTPASGLRTNSPSRSRGQVIDKAEESTQDDGPRIYDVAVLIVMPHPHLADRWDKLGEYAIGTTTIVASASPDDLIPS